MSGAVRLPLSGLPDPLSSQMTATAPTRTTSVWVLHCGRTAGVTWTKLWDLTSTADRATGPACLVQSGGHWGDAQQCSLLVEQGLARARLCALDVCPSSSQGAVAFLTKSTVVTTVCCLCNSSFRGSLRAGCAYKDRRWGAVEHNSEHSFVHSYSLSSDLALV